MGKPTEAVSGIGKDDDGWWVDIEVLELERIPPSTDILGRYRVIIDGDGTLTSFERLARYYRSQADSG